MLTQTATGARCSASLTFPLTLISLLAFLSLATPSRAQSPASCIPADGAGDSWLEEITNTLLAQEYHASRFEDGVQALNRANNFRTYFRQDGITLVPRTTPSPGGGFAWRTAAWGRESEPGTPAPPTLRCAGARVEYVYPDGLVEWYENGPLGLEQGFRIPSRPRGNGRLVVMGTIPEKLHPEVSADGREIVFSDGEATKTALIRYSKLQVVDAGGREIPSRLAATRGTIEILIDDRGASYPLAVDPLMTAPAWTAEIDSPNSGFGFSVASAGDVNGDAYGDVIVGAWQYDAGRAFVWYGSASGLGPNGTLGNADWSAEPSDFNARLGMSVASAGDVNGDGYDDVIIGADGYNNNAGRAFVWYGSAAGLGPNGTPANADWTARGTSQSLLGYPVAAAGDVNGDGYDDVIIGAGNYTNGEQFEGGAFVWYGNSSGLGPNGTPANADWSVESDQIAGYFGSAVAAAGDVNQDGYGDVVVGGRAYDGGAQDSGIALVFNGSASGLGPNGSPANADWRADSDQLFSDLGGTVASAGDVNGDGYADILVGAESYSNGQVGEGSAFLWYGSASGLGPNGTPANADWTAEGDSVGAQLGNPVATAGDVDGDGFSDVIIGSRCYRRGNTCVGRALVWFGSASGLGPNGTLFNADWINIYPTPNYAMSLATAGSVNGDPYDDVIVGCPQCANGQFDEGRAFVYHGAGNPTAIEPPPASGTVDLRLAAARPNPFSPGTQIEYVVPRAGHVRLTIYDAAGRQVTTLVDEWVEAYRQVAAWDGRDMTGSALPAGAYFIRLEAGGEVRTTKVTLTR